MIFLHLDGDTGILARAGCGKSKLYDDISKGLWPPLVKVGRCSVQPEHEVLTMQQAIVAGATEDQLRQLVRAMVTQRKMPALAESTSESATA